MTPEFSRPVRLDELSIQERRYDIEASAAERTALAERFGLQRIDKLAATVRLRSERGGKVVTLSGELEADVVQTCVVSLDPVPAHLAKSFELTYDRTANAEGREVILDANEIDLLPLEGDAVDIGEAVAEELALSLDPYPRAPGAVLEGGETPQDAGYRPFEILARFKRKP